MGKPNIILTQNFDASWGVPLPLDLRKDRVYEQLRIYVKLGSFVGGSSPAWVADAWLKAITTARIKVGEDVKTAVKPFIQRRLQKYECGADVQDVSDSEGEWAMWFTLTFKDEDYGFEARGLDSLQIVFDFATLASITTGSPTGTSGSVVTITAVWGVTKTNFYVAEDVVMVTLGVASTEVKEAYKFPAEIILKAGLHTSTDSGGITVSDSVIASYKTRHGAEEVLYDLTWAVSKAMDKSDYMIEALETGFTMIDLPQARVSSAQNELIIDVVTGSATGYAFIVKRILRPQ